MKKTLLVLVLLISIAGFATADGFHSMPQDRITAAAGFLSEGQSATLGIGTTDYALAFGEGGLTLQSMQVIACGDLLNFYGKEQFMYALGGSYSVDGTAAAIDEVAGYFGALTAGVSTNLPTFVENLEIMVGLGYHFDCGYAAMIYDNRSDLTALLDLSLIGFAFNTLVDWKLAGDLGVSLGFEVSVDVWGLTFPLEIAAADEFDIGPGVNFDIAVGVSIPNDLWEELEG